MIDDLMESKSLVISNPLHSMYSLYVFLNVFLLSHFVLNIAIFHFSFRFDVCTTIGTMRVYHHWYMLSMLIVNFLQFAQKYFVSLCSIPHMVHKNNLKIRDN